MKKKSLRRQLIDAPLQESDPLYEELFSLGFEARNTWIVNPYWSEDGIQINDPIGAWGMSFLESPIAAMLGFILPEIKFPPSPLMKENDQKKHENSLFSKIMNAREQEISSMG